MSMGQLDSELHKAAAAGDSDKITRLITAGAKVNSIDPVGNTALNWAAHNGKLLALRTLIAHGAKINQADHEGRSPLFWAAQNGHLFIVRELLLNSAIMTLVTRNRATPFSAALKSKHYDIIERLLLAGYRPNAHVDQKALNRALRSVSQDGDVDLIEQLIGLGAQVNSTDRIGDTALKWAAYNGHLKALKALLSYGADVNQADQEGRTPLLWAAQRSHPTVLAELLNAGANPNLITGSGDTPLSTAVREGHMVIVELLLQHCTLESITHSGGPNLLTIAAKNGRLNILQRLLAPDLRGLYKQNDFDQALLKACQYGRLAIARNLIEVGANVHHVNSSGESAIILAAQYEHADCFQALLEAGAQKPYHYSFKGVPTVLSDEVKKEAGIIKTYVVSHEAALPRRDFLFHATIGYALNYYTGEIIASHRLAQNYQALHQWLNKRFDEEFAKQPSKETANHKLLAINDVSRFLLGKDLFGEPVEPGLRTEIEDSLPEYNRKILQEGIQIQGYMERQGRFINDNTLAFGLSPSIGHIIREQIDIIVTSMTSEPTALRDAYVAYDKLTTELEARFQREQTDWKASGKMSDKSQALNDIFRYVLRKDILLDERLSPEDRTTLDPIAIVVPPPAIPLPAEAPRSVSPEATPVVPNRAGAGERPMQLAREQAHATANLSGAGAGSGACASYYEQERNSHFDELEAQAAFAKALPTASTSKPEVPAAGDLLEWYQREVAKQAEQTARDLRATRAAPEPTRPIHVPSDLAVIDFSQPEPAAPLPEAPASPSSVTSATSLVFGTETQADLRIFFPSVPRTTLPTPAVPAREESADSVELLTLA